MFAHTQVCLSVRTSVCVSFLFVYVCGLVCILFHMSVCVWVCHLFICVFHLCVCAHVHFHHAGTCVVCIHFHLSMCLCVCAHVLEAIQVS